MKNQSLRKKISIGFMLIDLVVFCVFVTSFITIFSVRKKVSGLDAEVSKAVSNITTNYMVLAIILFVVVGLLVTGVTTMILKTLRVSMTKLTNVATKIADGDLDVDTKKLANDEFGKVLDEFSVTVDVTRKQAELVGQIAEGDLTVEITPRSDADVMGKSLHKLVTGTHNAMSNIHDAAFQVMTSSSEVASASEALAQGSTEQASAIEEITASIDDIAEKTKTNAKNAGEAASLMGEAIVDVNRGNQRMKDMVVAMNDINTSSESISKIIKVIDDIAFQTNILALNAAVEAARAGDAGMGFAVVAEEVRSLAAKSATAAAETAEMIEDSIRKVQAGTGIADETAKALEIISEVVKKSEGIVRDIANSSEYQATAIEQIDQAVSQVSQVVQSNSSTSEECAAASMELSGQAERMQDLISVYNLGNGKSGGTSKKNNHSSYVPNEKNESIISLRDGFGKY